MPRTMRPPVSTSREVTALISTPGWRLGTAVTSVPSRMRCVRPAMNASVAYASSIGDSGGSPLSRVWKKWSMVQMLSTPAASAVVAIRVMIGPIWSGGHGQEKFVTPIPSLMKHSAYAQGIVSRATKHIISRLLYSHAKEACRPIAENPAAAFQPAFWAAKRVLARASATAFARHGVHEGQQYLLRTLWDEDGLAPGEVARRLGLATPTVTRAAARMEAAGLLRRVPHERDRRLVRLYLTDRGRVLEKEIGREIGNLTERALASLDQSERAALVRYLNSIRENLS